MRNRWLKTEHEDPRQDRTRGFRASSLSIFLSHKFDGRLRGTTGPKRAISKFPIPVPRPASLKSLTLNDKTSCGRGLPGPNAHQQGLIGEYWTRLEDLADDGHALCDSIGKESSQVTRRIDSAIIETKAVSQR